MKLTYHTGRNFGDALNPHILPKVFPGLLDDDDREVLIGIGSLFGLKQRKFEGQRRFYFSTGYAAGDSATYGNAPLLSELDEVICVRGPLTAKVLGLPTELAIADGAILAPWFMDVPEKPASSCSYVPHVGSFSFFSGLRDLMVSEGIVLIDPRDDVHDVLGQIASSDLVIAEAMHGAILADALRVPWVAATMYPTINKFKWEDFSASMELSHRPERIPSLFDEAVMKGMLQHKLGQLGAGALGGWAARAHNVLQSGLVRAQVNRSLRRIKRSRPNLSANSVIEERRERLLAKAREFVSRRITRA